jgi:hypothetical protein
MVIGNWIQTLNYSTNFAATSGYPSVAALTRRFSRSLDIPKHRHILSIVVQFFCRNELSSSPRIIKDKLTDFSPSYFLRFVSWDINGFGLSISPPPSPPAAPLPPPPKKKKSYYNILYLFVIQFDWTYFTEDEGELRLYF